MCSMPQQGAPRKGKQVEAVQIMDIRLLAHGMCDICDMMDLGVDTIYIVDERGIAQGKEITVKCKNYDFCQYMMEYVSEKNI